MCSTSFACSSWRRLASAALLLILPAVMLASEPFNHGRSSDIEQAWFRLTQDLDAQSFDRLKDDTDELGRVAAGLGLRRLTPLALALVVRARALPVADAEVLLHHATTLDPGCPEAWFALGANTLPRGRVAVAIPAIGRGLATVFSDGRLGHFAVPSLVVSIAFVVLAAIGLGLVVGIRRVLLLLWHDLTEAGAHLRLGPNTIVLNVFIIALPLLIGGDPVWMALWLFALCWAYFSTLGKAAGGLALLLLAFAPGAIEVANVSITHEPNAIMRATQVLDDERYDPPVVDNLVALGEVFGAEPEYYRLLGDLYRQHGQLDAAAWAYREGLRLKPQDGAISLALGAVHYLEGDFNSALQAFQVARDQRVRPVVVNYNLSLTLAQTYHFPESEAAMAAARAADAVEFARLTRGRSHQLILPNFDDADATRLLARKDTMVLLTQGLLPPPVPRERSTTHPLAIGSLLALLLAVGHFLVRRRTGGLAASCAKCGRAFCQRCKLSSESQTYCTQCVNIFLKKDMVAIETQLAKRNQLTRRQVLLGIESRALDILLPGLGLASTGRAWGSLLLVPLSILSLAVGAIWLPRFVGPALAHAPVWPLAGLVVAVWVACEVAAQVLPRGRR